MSFPRLFQVIVISFFGNCSLLHMFLNVALTSLSSPLHVIFVSFPFYFCMSSSCHFHARFMSASCHFHVNFKGICLYA